MSIVVALHFDDKLVIEHDVDEAGALNLIDRTIRLKAGNGTHNYVDPEGKPNQKDLAGLKSININF